MAAACLKLADERLHEPSTGHAERMAQRDGPAVRIDMRIVVGKSKSPQHSDALRGKGLVEFDAVELIDLQTKPAEPLLGGGDRADAQWGSGRPCWA